MREIVELKERIANLEGQINADHTLMAGLRTRLQQLEAELNDYKEIAEQTCNVCGEGRWEGGREGGEGRGGEGRGGEGRGGEGRGGEGRGGEGRGWVGGWVNIS